MEEVHKKQRSYVPELKQRLENLETIIQRNKECIEQLHDGHKLLREAVDTCNASLVELRSLIDEIEERITHRYTMRESYQLKLLKSNVDDIHRSVQYIFVSIVIIFIFQLYFWIT